MALEFARICMSIKKGRRINATWVRIPAVAALVCIGPGQGLADEALARKYGCMECHGVHERGFVGPSFQEISERYKDKPDTRKALFETIRKGGKGNWTKISHDVPMPPYEQRIPADDIQRLVDWLLSLR